MKNYFLKLTLLLPFIFLFNSCEDDNEDTNDNGVPCEELTFTFEASAETKNYIEYTFKASNINTVDSDDLVYDWSINGEIVTNGGVSGNKNQTFTYKFTKNDTYDVCVLIETPECPNAVEKCMEIKVDNIVEDITGTDCDKLDFSKNIISNNGLTYKFKANGEKNDVYKWYINGELATLFSGGGDFYTFEYDFKEEGTYEVCLANKTTGCIDDKKVCKEIKVEEINDSNPSGFLIEETGSSIDINANCPNITFDYVNTKQDPALYTLTATEYTEDGATIGYSWSVNDEFFATPTAENSKRIVDFKFEKVGVYEICVFVETPKCPNGVKYCKEFTVTAN